MHAGRDEKVDISRFIPYSPPLFEDTDGEGEGEEMGRFNSRSNAPVGLRQRVLSFGGGGMTRRHKQESGWRWDDLNTLAARKKEDMERSIRGMIDGVRSAVVRGGGGGVGLLPLQGIVPPSNPFLRSSGFRLPVP